MGVISSVYVCVFEVVCMEVAVSRFERSAVHTTTPPQRQPISYQSAASLEVTRKRQVVRLRVMPR